MLFRSGHDGWSFEGEHYTLDSSLFVPVPSGSTGPGGRPNLIVGGEGTPRGLRIAARWADEFNLTSASPDDARVKFAALDDECRAVGRDPRTLRRSVMAGLLVGATPAEVKRREAALLEAVGADDAAEAWLEIRRARWIHGTPDAARAQVARFAAAGAERLMLQDFLPWDLEMVELAAAALGVAAGG